MKLKSVLRLVGCIVLCMGVGYVEGLATRPEIPTWYASLVKPSWTPPPFAFPIAWTILYAMMAVTLWRLWDRVAPSPARRTAIIWFFVQLALNAAWSPVFFTLHNVKAALAIIVLMFGAIVMTIIASAKVDRIAAWLLVPYLIWVAYATSINIGVVWLNPG